MKFITMENPLEKIFTQADIQNYIDTGAEESTYLEFKGNEALLLDDDKKKIEISKDVSAFANADGGILIYGIEEKNNMATSFSFIDGNLITKERIENVIDSRVNRKINGLIIDPVRFDRDFTKTVYVVKIPASSNAPHMASDNKYYKRRNFKREPMVEYEVRELYARKTLTSLKIKQPKVITQGDRFNNNLDKLKKCHIKMEISIENTGSVLEKNFKLQLMIPRK